MKCIKSEIQTKLYSLVFTGYYKWKSFDIFDVVIIFLRVGNELQMIE